MSWPPTTLNATQQRNADTIIAVGRRLGASERDIQIALMTAMQESELINMNSGDRDSLGLFQQRAAWAPAAARMDPVQSATMFFTGGQGGQRGLFSFKNRDQMSLTAAAQAVQVSAYPDAYAKWSSLAQTAMGSTSIPAVSTTTAAPAAATIGPAAISPVGNARNEPVAAAPGAGEVTGQAGVGEVVTPGAGEITSPVGDPTDPAVPTGLNQGQFSSLFPDAATNATFSGALNKDTDARRSDIVTTAMSYLGTPYAWGGNGKSGIDCIAEGTPVLTRRGEVPIEDVRAGDEAMTRAGWRPVSRAWLVREDAVVVAVEVAGRLLGGTADHRVWTENRGWVALVDLTILDTLVLWDRPSASCSTGSPTSAIRTRLAPLTALTSSEARGTSIGRSGNTRTAPSPRGMRYTTEITTPSTTTSPTSNWSPFPNIGAKALQHGGCTNMFVQSAASHSWLSRIPARSVGSARGSTSGTASIASTGSACCVFDLTVEGEHEFFAAGVLVHNCSGLAQQVYKAFGIDIPRLSSDQVRAGQHVAFKDLKPGDLVGWDENSRNNGADHVAIYIGNNQIIEAPRPGLAVRIRTLDAQEMKTALGSHFAELG